jgi:23S rRNA pseudouridine1911/1915/1917 synthase
LVEAGENRPRLDLFLARYLKGESRASIQRLIRAGKVSRDGEVLKPAIRLRTGDRVVVVLSPAASSTILEPERIPLSLLHEDDDLLVVDKPSGMVVHPGAGIRHGTLVHALLGRNTSLSRVGGGERPGIVHRLDRQTSGLMVVAKNDLAHRALSAQFAQREIKKVYLALVWGHPRPPMGRIDLPLGRHPQARTRMAVRKSGGRQSVTEYRTLESLRHFSLLQVRPLTGRTHQIRVHLKHRGHPIAGDERYGGKGFRRLQPPALRETLEAFGRLALHASSLEFSHPVSGQVLHFQAPLPQDLELLLHRLREFK